MMENRLFLDPKIVAFNFGIPKQDNLNLCFKGTKIQVLDKQGLSHILIMIIIVISVAVGFEGLFDSGSGDNHARIWSLHKSMFVNKV